MTVTPYNRRFYDAIRPGCQRSADALAPFVTALLTPRSVVDVGGGEGWWADAFVRAGAERGMCLDSGERPQRSPLVEHGTLDLAGTLAPAALEVTADLAICLEVAEHLPASRARNLVQFLASVAPVVLFSAAQPRQGGTGHINCQPPGYWADLFAEVGFECYDLRPFIWEDDRIESWYRANTLLFADGNSWPLDSPPTGRPLHLLHPDLHLAPR